MEISSIGNASAMAEMRQRMFSKADADGSGGISLDEFKELGKAQKKGGPEGAGKAGGAPDPTEMFSKFDADGNGELTQAELDSGMQSMMEARTSKIKLGDDDGTSSLLEILAKDQDEQATSGTDNDDEDDKKVDLNALAAALAQYASAASGGSSSSSGIRV